MEEASGQVKKKLLQGMSVLKQYCVYSDINDKEKHKGLNSELVLKKKLSVLFNCFIPRYNLT